MDPIMVAKFKVERRTEEQGGVGTVELSVVCRTSPENEKFFQWTPFGNIRVGTLNKAPLAEMVPGREFYVQFVPAPEEKPTS